ncbi:MAG TPA: crossover junction endodeoxyribonuclease RuvC [Luteibaculaceae bacterium]|nr:crossover junction endodeoxyribonuclease RuvC [Luteibaculaceae bacterium]
MRDQAQSKGVQERIILGIDPGTIVMGYGIIKIIGNKPSLVTLGVIKLDKFTDHHIRLRRIFERTLGLIDEFKPDEIAIEAPFFGKNVQSMLKLGRAQGVAMAAALYRDLPVVEYEPRKIKQSITGKGAASKEQVAFMLQKALGFDELPQYTDATDGLAAAMCHYYKTSKPGIASKSNSWASFLKENPDKIIGSSAKKS